MATIKDGKGTFALVAFDKECNLVKHEIGRPAPGPRDVSIDILFCGCCHSDAHTLDGSWSVNKYPLAPGHEIAGVVKAVGAEVTKYKVGDNVAVGCHVGSCRTCDLCQRGLEQHCPQMLQTYSSIYPQGLGHDDCAGHWTNGGYSTAITVDEHFVFAVPASISLPEAGPLLCAGITVYSPLARHVLGQAGKTVGVAGFGGLGSMAVRIAKAMGAHVVVFSRSDAKKAAAEALGAELVATSDAAAMAARARTVDVIIDTVSGVHDVNSLVHTLKVGGALVMVGAEPKPHEISGFGLIFARAKVEGSLTGGVPETQEMLHFCAQHGIVPEIKIISAAEAPAAFKTLQVGDAGARRFVIDISTLHAL